MKLLTAFLLLICVCPPIFAWRLFGEPSDGKIRPVQALNDANKPQEVLSALTPQFVQTLRGTDLRQAYILLGDNHEKLGQTDKALGDYQLGVSLFPNNVDLLVRQAMLLHREGIDEHAKPLFLRALKFEPQHWNAHQGLAEIDRRSGYYDRSAEHYEITLKSVNERAEIWRDYSEVLLLLHDFKKAENAVQKAIALEPKNYENYVVLAFIDRERGDYSHALQHLNSAYECGAGIGALRAKAIFQMESGQLKEASAIAQLILKEVPADGVAHWVLARARFAIGEVNAAKTELALIRPSDEANVFAAQAAKTLLSAQK